MEKFKSLLLSIQTIRILYKTPSTPNTGKLSPPKLQPRALIKYTQHDSFHWKTIHRKEEPCIPYTLIPNKGKEVFFPLPKRGKVIYEGLICEKGVNMTRCGYISHHNVLAYKGVCWFLGLFAFAYCYFEGWGVQLALEFNGGERSGGNRR